VLHPVASLYDAIVMKEETLVTHVLRVFVAFAWMIGLAVSAAGQSGGKIDVTGDWEFTVETSEGSGDPSFSFKQDGEKLTGRYKGLFGEADLTGTVKGDKIEFSFKVSGQIEGVITYTGTTDGKTMTGKVDLAGAAEGTFTGKRKGELSIGDCRLLIG
jgi:hypothetical protein